MVKNAKIGDYLATFEGRPASYYIENLKTPKAMERTTELMNEKEFLQGYEIKNWEFSPRIYKILVGAAVVHIVSLLLLAQTNFMSASACQSPFVSRVCNVLDTVYVGSKLFSGEKDYVVREYNRTQIDDADVVWVDTTQVEPQLTYPTGYFEIANRDELAAQRLAEEMASNGLSNQTLPPATIPPANPPVYRPPVNRTPVIPSRRDSIARRPQKLPKPKDNVTKGEIDEDLFKIDDSDDGKVADTGDKNGKGEGDKPKNPADKDDKTPKGKTPNDANGLTTVEINKKPLQDFADEVVDKWAKKEIDLNQQFVVRLVGRIRDDGRLDRENSRFDTEADQGDEKMINLAKRAIEAVGDSGWLTYLRNLGAREIVITVMQNDENIVARVESKMKSESEARTMASGMSTLISTTRQFVKLGEDETKLLNAAKKPTHRGNTFILDMQMAKPEAQEMMNRKLNEAWAKKQKEQNNGGQPAAQPNGTARQKDARTDLAR